MVRTRTGGGLEVPPTMSPHKEGIIQTRRFSAGLREVLKSTSKADRIRKTQLRRSPKGRTKAPYVVETDVTELPVVLYKINKRGRKMTEDRSDDEDAIQGSASPGSCVEFTCMHYKIANRKPPNKKAAAEELQRLRGKGKVPDYTKLLDIKISIPLIPIEVMIRKMNGESYVGSLLKAGSNSGPNLRGSKEVDLSSHYPRFGDVESTANSITSADEASLPESEKGMESIEERKQNSKTKFQIQYERANREMKRRAQKQKDEEAENQIFDYEIFPLKENPCVDDEIFKQWVNRDKELDPLPEDLIGCPMLLQHYNRAKPKQFPLNYNPRQKVIQEIMDHVKRINAFKSGRKVSVGNNNSTPATTSSAQDYELKNVKIKFSKIKWKDPLVMEKLISNDHEGTTKITEAKWEKL